MMLAPARFICSAVLVLTIAVAPAAAQTRSGKPPVANPVKKRNPARPVQAPQGQIACGRYGCVRIPPNCHPEETYDQWGNPTGFDAIVCR